MTTSGSLEPVMQEFRDSSSLRTPSLFCAGFDG